MKKEIERLNEKYNININIERSRYDVYDHRSGYFTRLWARVNDSIICVIKDKSTSLEDVIEELESKIKVALG